MGISGIPAPPDGAAAPAAGAGADGPRRKASTSSLVMRFFSPVPLNLLRSTPSSRATRRTPGLAWTWLKSVVAAGCAPTDAPGAEGAAGAAGAAVCEAGGAAAARGAGGGSCCESNEGGWLRAPSSLPLRRTTAVPSLTLSPTLTRTVSTVPPLGAGTSIVALSDSQRDQRVLGVDGVPGLDVDFDNRNVLKVADIGHFDFRGRHVSLPCVSARAASWAGVAGWFCQVRPV